jgi:hypothetical protein
MWVEAGMIIGRSSEMRGKNAAMAAVGRVTQGLSKLMVVMQV